MYKMIRVNMTEKQIQIQDVPEKYLALGARALTSQFVFDEVDPCCHPLGEGNKLIIAPGLVSGTRAPSSGRISFGAKSPLTDGIKESNAGGITSQHLANLGIKAVVIEGLGNPADPYVLVLKKDQYDLVPAPELKLKGTYETTELLRQKYGAKAAVICIGPAGEHLMMSAGIANCDTEGNSSRYAGRGGLGAVMGSKGLKAIVVEAPGLFDAPVADPNRFSEAAKKFTKFILDHPITGQGLPAFGTNVLMNILNEAGALPTKNFREGRFEYANNVGGETVAKMCEERGGKATHACHPGCVIRCSNVVPLKSGKTCSPIEYESAWSLGTHCTISDADMVGELNWLCNDIGLDTIEAGGTLGVAMEAGVIPFGDAEGAIKLLEEIRQATPLGRILGNGAGFTGKAFGVTRVGVVKNQHIPAYDPRGVKGIGVTYATTPMGADHTAGYAIATNILKSGGYVDPLTKEGQVELSRNLQIATAALDATGLCLFVAFPVLDSPEGLPTICEMINAQYGTSITVDDVVALGKNILAIEREFNRRAGFTAAHDRLPEFFKTDKLAPHDTVFDITDEELDEVFNFIEPAGSASA